MVRDRSCGLALLHVHGEIDLSTDEIADRFAKKNLDIIIK